MSSSTTELGNTMVRAGAGAGKTRGLVEQIVSIYKRFCREQESSPRIVLTTFTRKATQELKERLILRACSDQDADFLQFVTDPSRLHISTIHGLLHVFLQQVGHLAGMDSGFQIVSEGEGQQLARLALREVLVKEPEFLQWLEVYGFERVLEMVRAHSVQRREAGELHAASLEDLQTAAEQQLRVWHGELLELSAEVLRGTSDPKWILFAEALRKTTPQTLKQLPTKPRRSAKQEDLEFLHLAVESTLGEIKKKLERAGWNEALWPVMVEQWQRFEPFAEAFSTELEGQKDRQGRFELVDLELKTLEILRSKPFLGSVFAENWDYWMIDEYQDTSPLQVAVLQALISNQPKYLVGDPQQSIYLFRGAEVEVFRRAEQEITAAGGQIVELIKNYRSQPELLCWINDFMASVGPAFVRMEPRESVTATVENRVLLWRAPDRATEVRGLIARIHQLVKGGARLEEICILSRTHRNLMELARVLREYGYPTHVHAARGFGTRREVLDAQALWKFLVNPHDNMNLLLLFRSPWFFVPDQQLSEWMSSRPHSLWRRLQSQETVPEAVLRLRQCHAELEESGMARTFEQALLRNAYLDLSLHDDPAGRKESNLWKLIARARTLEKEGGESILNLMQNEDPLDTNEGDATSAQEPNCINLMTIHGSKGLEFDHVLLPHMEESPQTSHTPVLSSEAGLFHFPAWSEEEGEFVASPMDFLTTQSRRRKELAEYDRWLYVALTRAKETLTLSWCGLERDSWASRSSWFGKSAGEHITSDYRVSLVEEMPEPQTYLKTQVYRAQVRPQLGTFAGGTVPQRISVTDLIGKEEREVFNSEGVLKRWQAKTLGTRLHRVFEALKYHRDLQVEGVEAEALEYLMGLQEIPLREWIEKGEVEWGFQVQARSGLVEGQIDLWTKHEGRIYIVDYKSGSTKYKESAFDQLGLYAWALRKFGHDEPIELVVIYPLKKQYEQRSMSAELLSHWESKLA